MTIYELRMQTGLSQKEFCDKFHLGLRALQSWEQGWRNCPEYVTYLISCILEYERKELCEKEKTV